MIRFRACLVIQFLARTREGRCDFWYTFAFTEHKSRLGHFAPGLTMRFL
ncbi:hypothetical protein JOE21_001957 [Desmospora profundinema]|uniref:Uncharacterized protein n=1 Tax=Desmospora profundinema TaxID=1571184 RepID=A0ABU1IMM8_9BACL|nr:hypothetical protein [Desmospora profundinema]